MLLVMSLISLVMGALRTGKQRFKAGNEAGSWVLLLLLTGSIH